MTVHRLHTQLFIVYHDIHKGFWDAFLKFRQ